MSGLSPALRAGSRLVLRFAFVDREWEKLFALLTCADFEVGGAIRVDLCGEQQFEGIVAEGHTVGEFYDGQAVVKYFERGFLSLSCKDMADHEDRLSFSLSTKVAQGVLRGGHAGELAGGTGSNCRHRSRSNKLM